jgi:hypothetical protein
MFDGAPKNFQIWWMRFVAYAMVYKFNKAIGKDAIDPDTSECAKTCSALWKI